MCCFFFLENCGAKLMCIYFLNTCNIWNDFLLLVQFLVITGHSPPKIWFWWQVTKVHQLYFGFYRHRYLSKVKQMSEWEDVWYIGPTSLKKLLGYLSYASWRTVQNRLLQEVKQLILFMYSVNSLGRVIFT